MRTKFRCDAKVLHNDAVIVSTRLVLKGRRHV